MPKISLVKNYRTFADRALGSATNNSAFDDAAKDSVGKDAFRNAVARMGYGTPSVAEGVEYILERWTNNYWLMITLFRNHWIPRKIVEIPAKDMCKAWPRLNCDLTPDQIADFDRTIERSLTPKKIKRAITWARLFGGAGALMVIKGHENILDQPLDLDMINPGSYKGLIVFDRWSGITPVGNQMQDIESPLTFGLPEYYTVHGQNGNEALFDIHASRILRFTGPDVPTPEHEANQYWGISVIELAMEEMRKRDNASWSILQLLFRAQLLTQVNPELAQLLSGAVVGGAGLQRFQQSMQAQNELLSNQSMLLLGKDGKLESHQYTFGGIADVLDRFEIACAASSNPSIPYSKLFGKNSSGLDNSNDADERNYEEAIAQAQHDDLRPQLMQQLYPVICMSEFGEVPDDLDITFPSIRVLTEEDKTKLAKEGGEAILAAFAAGVTSQQLTLQELKQLGDKTEIFSNITPEIIEAADDKPVPPIEIEQAEARAGTETFSEGTDEWNEEDHPRDNGGMFTVGNHSVIHRDDFRDMWGKAIEPAHNNEFVVRRYMPESHWQSGIKGTSSFEEGMNPASYQHRGNSKTFEGAKRIAVKLHKEEEENERQYQAHKQIRVKADTLVSALEEKGIKATVYQAITGSTYISLKNVKSANKRIGENEVSTQIRLADHPGRHWEPTEWDYHDENAKEYAEKLFQQLKSENRL